MRRIFTTNRRAWAEGEEKGMKILVSKSQRIIVGHAGAEGSSFIMPFVLSLTPKVT